MPDRTEFTESNTVDIGKRYDIYVAETQSRVVVYRNAFFRGLKELEEDRTRHFRWSDFVEIEQSDGSSVFIRKYSLICFCEAGKKLTCELVTPAG
jgi:hypothetical protein